MVHDTCVVEEDIHAAPRVQMLDHGLDIGFLGDIGDLGLDLLGLWYYLFELGSSLLQGRARDVGEEDIAAFPEKENGGLETDATGYC